MTDLRTRAIERLAKLEAFAARRHVHMVATGRDRAPAEATFPAAELDALGLAGLDRVNLSDWLILRRATAPILEVEGPAVPAGAACDDCGVPDPPSLIAWPAEDRWTVTMRHGEMRAPQRRTIGPMLCEFCDDLRRRAGLH